MKIEREGLFRRALQDGINLFSGAGFSVLADEDGHALPTGPELASEVAKKFDIAAGPLDRISSLAQLRYPDELQSFLRSRLTLETYNPLYRVLDRVNISGYITTNADNLMRLVYEDAGTHYLHNVINDGVSKRNGTLVPYYPLHGTVDDVNRPLIFSEASIRMAGDANPALFQAMRVSLMLSPTLFWGYGFHDHAVMQMITELLQDTQGQQMWVLCPPGDANREYFKELGLNIIDGDTRELLEWLENNLAQRESIAGNVLAEKLDRYVAPPKETPAAVTWEDYLVEGRTTWYAILQRRQFITSTMQDIADKSEQNENLIVVGLPFCGKTTLLMWQANISSADTKLFVPSPTLSEAEWILRELGDQECTVYVDDCAADMRATALFLKAQNVRVVAAANDFQFESARHLLRGQDFTVCDITELSKRDAQNMYRWMSPTIRTRDFSYTRTAVRNGRRERFSMFEMIAKNVSRAPWKQRIETVLRRLFQTNIDAFDVVVLAAFLERHGSALNLDTLFGYFPDLHTYDEVRQLIGTVRSCLAEDNLDLSPDRYDQDYYFVRSHMFADEVYNLLLSEEWIDRLANILEQLYRNVAPIRIYRNYIFRRSAYDAELFYRIFGNTGAEVYDVLLNRADRPKERAYILQQYAAFNDMFGEYSRAFAQIDEAVQLFPQNQSIYNTRAHILFHANRGQNTEDGRAGRLKAMRMLEGCIRQDERTVYHVQTYGDFACILAQEQKDPSFLEPAIEYFRKLQDVHGTLSYQSRSILRNLEANLARATR